MNARPSMVSITCPDHANSTGPMARKARAPPGLQPVESLFGVLHLPRPVILASLDGVSYYLAGGAGAIPVLDRLWSRR